MKTPGVAYVYWPEYDMLCHTFGTTHPRTLKHLERVDHLLADVAEYLRKRDVLFVVSADHGLVDVPPERWINLAEVPGFYELLMAVPYGDSRQVQCRLKPGCEEAFDRLVHKQFAEAAVLCSGDWLIDQGVYGCGTPHPQFHSRLGDRVLIAKENYAFAMPWPGEVSQPLVGYHSGMTKREMVVPVYIS